MPSLERHLRARRHADDEVLARRAVAQRALAVAPAAGLVVGLALERLQVAQRGVAEQHDAAAVTSVTAVGSTFGYMGLAAERVQPAPAAATLHEDAGLVVEHVSSKGSSMADPVFLITGASTGIGAATARAAAEAGHRLVLAARSEDKLQALAVRARRRGPRDRRPLRRDRVGGQRARVQAALDAFGRLDVVFANAGFGAKRGWLEETPEFWKSMVLTNVLGPAYTARAAIPALKESKGHLLLTSSVAGRRALPGSLYSAHQARGDRDGRGAASGPQRDRRARDEHRARHGRHAVLRRQAADSGALEPDDIARAVMYAVSQPPHVDVNEILIRPTAQPI